METKITESAKARLHGQLTVEIAKSLKYEDYDIFYDHGVSSKNVGRIVSHFSDQNEHGTQLSYLDIAIVRKNTNKAIALIEIEETADRPKTLISDIFGFLLGERVVFKGREFEVGKQTTLIVIGFSKVQNKKHHQYIIEKVEKAKSALGTKNSKIGKIVIGTFSDEKKLSLLVQSLLKNAFKGER